MKRYILLSVFTCFLGVLQAQQDVQFTQFMFNKLAFNPAYAGSQEVPSLTLLLRRQWAGLSGAPESQMVSMHAPFFNNRVGLGLSISNDEIGPTQSMEIGTSYAYRVGLEKGTISIGIKASIRNYRVNWEEVIATHENDFLIETPIDSEMLLNVGVGAYYENDRLYVGVSVPNLNRGDLSLLGDFIGTQRATSFESRHVYGMASYLFNLSSQFILKPAVLLKMVKNAPFDMDVNIMAIYNSKVWFGLTYRTGGSSVQGFGESIDYILQYQLSHNFRAGIAFDQSLSELKAFNSGTFEVMTHYNFQSPNQKSTNPRFF